MYISGKVADRIRLVAKMRNVTVKKMLKDMGIYEGDIDYIVSIIGNNFSSITDLQELLRTNSSRLDKHISVVSRYIVSRLVS